MATLNKVLLMGNVGNEPEVKDTASTKIVTFSLCTTERGYTKNDGSKVEDRSEWHRIKTFGKLAETIAKYVHKGTPLYIEAHLHYDSYEKDGKKTYTTELIADNFQFLESKSKGSDNNTNTSSSPTNTSAKADDDMPF